MLDDATIGVSRHAMARFRERVDPTATAQQVISYVRKAVPNTHIQSVARKYGYGLKEILFMYTTVEFRYLHVTFIVRGKHGKGAKQIVVVTCF